MDTQDKLLEAYLVWQAGKQRLDQKFVTAITEIEEKMKRLSSELQGKVQEGQEGSVRRTQQLRDLIKYLERLLAGLHSTGRGN